MPDARYFAYGSRETDWLTSRDPRLGAVIAQVGPIRREVTPDLFAALVYAIVGQQISTKAQVTICIRLRERFAPLSPETIGNASAEDLHQCGISMRKATYIKNIAETVLRGDIALQQLHALPDHEVCARLSAVKGIGVWTAEMLMTFSMQRPDILSWGDLAIHRGLRMIYRHRVITPALFAKYKRRYSPYASVASLYLWAVAGGACPGLADCAPKVKAAKKAVSRKPETAVPKG